MNLPKDSRVIVIDDKPEEIIHLIRVLSRHGISVTYLSGGKEELPEKPFSAVRMIFLDLVLEGVPSQNDKNIISTLINVLSRIVEKDRSGPFILVIWTKHPEKIEIIQKALISEGYKFFIIDLQKDEFFEINGAPKISDEGEMFKKIEGKIQNKLQNIGIFDILLLWENIVHSSSVATVNEFSKLILFNEGWNAEKWNKEMKKIFYKLAEAQAGKALDTNLSQEVLKNALFTFGGIFVDTLEKNLHEESYNQMDFSSLENGVEEDVKGKINSRLILDKSGLDRLYPGNVYEIKNDGLLKKIIYDSIYLEKLLEKFADMKGVNLEVILNKDKKIKNEYKPDFKRFFKKIRDTIKDNSILVQTEVSPLCDFVQNKMKLSRIVKGFLCPVEVQINGTTIQTYKKLRSNAHFLYISPVIKYGKKLYRLIIDFRHFSAKPIDEIKKTHRFLDFAKIFSLIFRQNFHRILTDRGCFSLNEMFAIMRGKIIDWYQNHDRDFPWRHTKDPYKIMIAEFMLHRTKAEQVVPVYLEFIRKYPDIKTLVWANFKDIEKVTEHLGLHWRAKHFSEAAKYVVNNYKDKFPEDYNELKKIPGVGEYVAGAISTVCFNKPAPVVDSNIARFINRYFGLNLSGEIRKKKKIVELSAKLFEYENPGNLLFAAIDFTSLICKPGKPLCGKCLLKDKCNYVRSPSPKYMGLNRDE